MFININANKIIELLQSAGHKAYVVGGCVRDAYMGTAPKDWDICTSATTEEMRMVFKDYKIYNTGEKHGTLTININNELFEVTTFRKDGKYSDSRHPDTVEFVPDVKEDLERRDFTINAIAFNYNEDYIDPFNGCDDIKNGIIRCVGNPEERFKEDALRILRALRFSSRYGFKIDNDTLIAMYNHTLHGGLYKIAKERIREEFIKIIDGPYAYNILHNYYGIICNIIPYISECVGFDQNNKYHIFDVYEHSLQALKHYIDSGETDVNIKIALFLHDIGKPDCYFEDDRGGHFYGHPEVSKKKAEYIMNILRFSNADKNEILTLIQYHDITIEPTKKSVRRALNKLGETALRKIFKMQKADIASHSPINREERYNRILEKEAILQQIIDALDCFSLKDLNVKGGDILDIGFEGKEIGETLKQLLDEVISNKINNDRDTLLIRAKELYEERNVE